MTTLAPPPTARTFAVIIGSGFAGIGAAIKLKQMGIRDFVILERADDIGGTWRDNTYPGAACDIPSHLYSFSFEPETEWSRAYAPQDEIWSYLQRVTERWGLRDHLRFATTATEAAFDEFTGTWAVHTDRDEVIECQVVIGALGGLRDPAYPHVPGRETFTGAEMHSARWDHDVDLTGKRVAVVGTGASAIQIVPALAGVAERLYLVQRTPAWVIPRNDREYSERVKEVFRRVPGARALHRTFQYWTKEARYLGFGPWGDKLMPLVEKIALKYMKSRVTDPDKQAALVPDYRMGCKRILISDDYYDAVAREDVEIVNGGLAEVTPDGIVTPDGRHLAVDAIIYATGFQVDKVLGDLDVRGLGGKDLNKTWGSRPSAYLGMSVPDFPNLFLMVGPNTGLGHNSIIFMIESQLNYLQGAIDRLRRPGVAYLDVTEDALQGFEAEVAARHARSVWASGCESWYLGEDGHNYTLWPGSSAEYRLRTRRFDPEPYRVVHRTHLPRPEPLGATG